MNNGGLTLILKYNMHFLLRLVALKGSHFDGKKQLLDALRTRFPGGTVTLGTDVTSREVVDYWHALQEDYRSDVNKEERICLGTSSYGLQDHSNYWFLAPQLHIKNSKKLEEGDYIYFDPDDALHNYATVLDEHLLNLDSLLQATESFLGLATYFGCNFGQFLMAVPFTVARILRANKSDETWSESNIGLIFSTAKNCGKSLSLHLISKGQGIPVRRHLLILSGGNQNTSGTSDKKVHEVMAKTSLVVLVDDPLISQQLGEFLNQVQSGLLQGSTAFGMQAPRASLLISSNNKEVERVAGRVIRFNYNKEVCHDETDRTREAQLIDFMDNNKGLFVAWAIRFLPLWEEITEAHGDELRTLLRKALPHQQPRWVKGLMFCIMANMMIHASAKKALDVVGLLSNIVANNTKTQERPPFYFRIQNEAIDKLKDGPEKILTWLNPMTNVRISKDEELEPAFAFKSEVIGRFHSASRNEVAEEIKKSTVNGFSQTCSFARNETTTVDHIKKKDKEHCANAKAHKIPVQYLEPSFVKYVKYLTGINDNTADSSPPPVPDLTAETAITPVITEEDQDKLLLLYDTVANKVTTFSEKQPADESLSTTTVPSSAVLKALSPESRATYQKYTPKRQEAFEKGMLAGMKRARLSTEHMSTESTSQEHNNYRTPLVEGDGGPKARKSLFGPSLEVVESQEADDTGISIPESVPGTVGVFERTKGPSKKRSNKRKGRSQVCEKCGKADPPRDKETVVDWVGCDSCDCWFHNVCLGLKEINQEHWYCPSCDLNH